MDLYNRLACGVAGNKATTFTEPAAEPTGGSGIKTLDEIMGMMPAIDTMTGATAAEVLSAKTFWGLTGGAWGLRTGTATAGANVTGTNGQLQMTIPDGLCSGSKTATVSDTNLTVGNIKSGVTIFGVAGSVVEAAGNATAADVLSGKTFSNGSNASLSGGMTDITSDQASTAQETGTGVITLTAPRVTAMGRIR